VTEAFLVVVGPCATALAIWSLAVDEGWAHWIKVSATAGAALATAVVMLLVILFPRGQSGQSDDDEATAAPHALPPQGLPPETEREALQG
jgi:hypothetical protein